MEFKLKKGMTEQEILGELKGKVSGETRQEAQLLLKPQIANAKAYFEVLEANSTYGIIRKYTQTKESTSEYYLTGINDEGKYFMRQLGEEAISRPLDQLMDWVNKTDEGFSMRLQGDVLLKFLHYHNRRHPILPQDSPLSRFRAIELLDRLTEARTRQMLLFQGFTYSTGNWSVLGRMDQRITELALGNHILSSDGYIFYQGGDYIVVDANELTLQHYEHQIKMQPIPREHFAVLTGQRGRTIQMSIRSNMMMSFQRLGGFD